MAPGREHEIHSPSIIRIRATFDECTSLQTLENALNRVRVHRRQAAESVLLLDQMVRTQSESLLSRKATRLSAEDPGYLELVRLEMGLVDQLRRIYSLAKRIARVTLPPAIAQKA